MQDTALTLPRIPKPQRLLHPTRSLRLHVRDIGPFIKQREAGAALANLLAIRLSEGQGESNLLAAGAADLSLSHKALVTCLQ